MYSSHQLVGSTRLILFLLHNLNVHTNNQRITKGGTMTMLGLLVIINSLCKGIQWYNNNTASDIGMAMGKLSP